MLSRVTISRILMWAGLSAAIVLSILAHISGPSRLRFFSYPYPVTVLSIYIIGIALLKKVWGFYVVTVALAIWAGLWSVLVLVQHLLGSIGPKLYGPSFWLFEEPLLQAVELWGLSILILLSGLVGTCIFLRARHGVKLHDIGKLKNRPTQFSTVGSLAVLAIIPPLTVLLMPPLSKVRGKRMICIGNMLGLGRAIQLYAEQNEGSYPMADKWCDLLIEAGLASEAHFVCPEAGTGRCHYAMNSHAEPNSAGDTVLLFETNAGWNQAGGPEILTADHHPRGCNIVFTADHCRFVRTNDLANLRWKADPNDN
jgi:hypothetical protein